MTLLHLENVLINHLPTLYSVLKFLGKTVTYLEDLEGGSNKQIGF